MTTPKRPKRILFVCTANVDRSPTAEAILKGIKGFEVQSAGIWPNARRRITKELIDWADIIFAMEDYHKEVIVSLKPEAENKTIVLNVPDIYPRNDPNLIKILKERISEHLGIVWEE